MCKRNAAAETGRAGVVRANPGPAATECQAPFNLLAMGRMNRRLAVLVCTVLAAWGCSQKIPIRAEGNPTTNMSAYRTYNWASRPVADAPQTELGRLDWYVRNAVERALSSKGYVKDTEGPIDFFVGYRVSAKDAVVNTVTDYTKYREMGGKAGIDEAYVFGYREGTLALEIIDARSEALAWRATAQAVVDPAVREQTIDTAVRQMLEQFPSR